MRLSKTPLSVFLLLFLSIPLLSIPLFGSDSAWKSILADRLAEYGHRNWIVIADAAYPKQSAPGIETVVTDADQLEVVRAVMEAVNAAAHVRPLIQVDSELEYVSEKWAPGVTQYREDLWSLLDRNEVTANPHEAIIHQLDEASQLVDVLILKTNMVLPYTSVFIQLDCGYWSAEAEADLREAVEGL